MSKRNNQSKKSGLALTMAAGGSVVAWARENQVPVRTARNWSNSPEVLKLVERIRRRTIDRAVGRLSKHATAAVDEIARLAKGAASEAVRLSAARAVLAEMMAVASYSALNGRMAELERMVCQNARPPIPDDPSPTPDLPSSADVPESDPSDSPA